MAKRSCPADFVLCIGDDRSDEDMFEGIGNKNLVSSNAHVYSCTVGQKPSKATYYLDDTNDVLEMLRALADVSEEDEDDDNEEGTEDSVDDELEEDSS